MPIAEKRERSTQPRRGPHPLPERETPFKQIRISETNETADDRSEDSRPSASRGLHPFFRRDTREAGTA